MDSNQKSKGSKADGKRRKTKVRSDDNRVSPDGKGSGPGGKRRQSGVIGDGNWVEQMIWGMCPPFATNSNLINWGEAGGREETKNSDGQRRSVTATSTNKGAKKLILLRFKRQQTSEGQTNEELKRRTRVYFLGYLGRRCERKGKKEGERKEES